jgi:hypothetical protein
VVAARPQPRKETAVLLHLDLPSFTNAGGVLVLPALLLLAFAAAGHEFRSRHNNQGGDQ